MNNGKQHSEELYGPHPAEQSRVPPQAVEVEKSILGSMFTDEEAALSALEMLKADDFYKPAHQHIFRSINELFMDDKSFDLLLVEDDLRNNGLLDSCGGSGYLSDLMMSSGSSANMEYHCAIIEEKSKRRQLILACNEITKEACRSDNDTYDVLDQAEHRIFEVNQTKLSKEAEHISEYLSDYMSDVSDVREDPDNRTGVMTGTDIDRIIPGFKPSNLVILAARPSMGKTALMLTIARNMAQGRGIQERKVGVFSMEMSAKELVGRLVNMESHVSGQQAEMGKITDEEFNRMLDASGRLMDMNIWIDDTAGLSLIDLRSKARKMIQKHGIEIIFVDFLQLMTYNGLANSRHDQVTAISRGLKLIAKTYGIPVVALSQLSRAVETRGGDKRPVLSDLRESGSIEENADIVKFLYRPEYYDIKTTAEGESTDGLAEVIVRKHRGGPTGTIPLRFVKEYAVFENMAYTENKVDEESPF